MFTAVPFTIAKQWTQPKLSSANDCMQQACSICLMDFSEWNKAWRRKEILIRATPGMNPEDIHARHRLNTVCVHLHYVPGISRFRVRKFMGCGNRENGKPNFLYGISGLLWQQCWWLHSSLPLNRTLGDSKNPKLETQLWVLSLEQWAPLFSR